jgi:hypothetical protein
VAPSQLGSSMPMEDRCVPMPDDQAIVSSVEVPAPSTNNSDGTRPRTRLRNNIKKPKV